VKEFEKNYCTEMCSGSEAGSYLRLIDFVHQPPLCLRVIKEKKKIAVPQRGATPPAILKLTIWFCGTNPSTLERLWYKPVNFEAGESPVSRNVPLWFAGDPKH
jgi:hypothetical protein